MTDRHRVQWSPAALEDLIDTIEYIAREAGVELGVALHETGRRVAALVRDPTRYPLVPELKAIGVTAYRELSIAPYRVFFRMDGGVVGITAVLDERRDIEERLVLRGLPRTGP